MPDATEEAGAPHGLGACNTLPDDGVSGFLSTGKIAMERMGVMATDYDIAHYFGASGGGGLGRCCACQDDNKAGGGTAMSNPNGDYFNVGCHYRVVLPLLVSLCCWLVGFFLCCVCHHSVLHRSIMSHTRSVINLV